MMERSKIQATHLARNSVVYIRQSSAAQVERNRESTDRQYRLVERALELGWRRDQVIIIDEDLGRTGSGAVERSGFVKMSSDVALGQIGIIIGLEASRLARNNRDWYQLLEIAGITDTLIADADGVYHPGQINDRLLLGLKGTMSEAELHLIRERLTGGIRNKAARGELRCKIPVGYVWSGDGGEMKFHPDEAVTGAIRNVFERFAELGSARQAWLWFNKNALPFPIQKASGELKWSPPRYGHIKDILKNPVYAGVYAYGRSRTQRFIDETGRIRHRSKGLPRHDWLAFIHDHHEGFITWETYQQNQERLRNNFTSHPHEVGGAVREGAALLQGLATCGRCGRRLHVKYEGRNSTPGYWCPATILNAGATTLCFRVGARQIDHAVVNLFLETMNPVGVEAALLAETDLEAEHDAALKQWRLEVERARYNAEKAERRYLTVEPENRLVARGLEAELEKCLRQLADAEAELIVREKQRPRELTTEERARLRGLSVDIEKVWSSTTTTDRDRKEMLRTVIEEVNVQLEPQRSKAHLTVYWRGGSITELDLDLKRRIVPSLRTDEDTIELTRRLALHYTDEVIASILNKQCRRTARGERFTTQSVKRLRRNWKIPKPVTQRRAEEEGELVTIAQAGKLLGVATSTLHRFVAEGFLPGEQLTPGAPWRIRITDELRARFTCEEPEGYISMKKAIVVLGVSRQTIMQRIKRGDLQAIFTWRGKRKELRIKGPASAEGKTGQLKLF